MDWRFWKWILDVILEYRRAIVFWMVKMVSETWHLVKDSALKMDFRNGLQFPGSESGFWILE